MARVYVREATPEDVDQLARLVARLKELNEELDPHFKTVDNLEEQARKYVEEAVAADNRKVIVAADEETGEAVGLVILELQDRVFYEPRIKAVITDFYVLPRYRRRRVGTLLLEKAEEAAREAGAGIITAVYPAGNSIAASFYKGRGFRELQVEVYKPL